MLTMVEHESVVTGSVFKMEQVVSLRVTKCSSTGAKKLNLDVPVAT